jgi:hypothetical protein
MRFTQSVFRNTRFIRNDNLGYVTSVSFAVNGYFFIVLFISIFLPSKRYIQICLPANVFLAVTWNVSRRMETYIRSQMFRCPSCALENSVSPSHSALCRYHTVYNSKLHTSVSYRASEASCIQDADAPIAKLNTVRKMIR